MPRALPVERGTRKSTTLAASCARPANACGALWSNRCGLTRWQDDLERKDKLLSQAHKELVYIEEQNSLLQQQIAFLENLLGFEGSRDRSLEYALGRPGKKEVPIKALLLLCGW